MRFKREERFVYDDTPRKRSAAARALQREQDRLPLLADQIAEEQEARGGVQGRIDRQLEAIASSEAAMRDLRARHWREGRARFYALSDNYRALVLHYWNTSHYPATGTYFAGLMRRIDDGQFCPAEHLESVSRAARMGREWREKISAERQVQP